MKLHALWLSASALALIWCETAAAQSSSTTPGSTASQAKPAEIVITGERRTQNLMTTPVTATVLGGEDVQRRDLVNVNTLQFITPNVTVNDLGQGIDFNIRGIGKGEHNTQTPIGVIVYRDGAATFPGYLTAQPFYDIKSIEVYRGPQGTFVGQNATGGAVFVTTNDPDLAGGYNGYQLAQYGNYSEGQLQGAVDVHFTDKLALRLAGLLERRDSFYTILDRDPADACPNFVYAGCKAGYKDADLRQAAGRLSLLWKPAEAFTVSVKFDALYQDFGAAPAKPYSELLPVGACVQPWGAANGCGAGYTWAINPYHNSDLFTVTANAPEDRRDREHRTILKVAYEFANGVKLQSISDYNRGLGIWRTDLDLTDYGNPSDYPYFGNIKNWTFFDSVGETLYSEEINLISADNKPVAWVLGLYAQENDYDWRSPYQFWVAVGPRIGSDPTPSAANFYQYTSWTFEGKTTNRNIAAFGQIEAKLGNGFSASLGGRWTETRSHNDILIWSYGGSPFGTPFHDTGSQKSSAFTYKAALSWAVNEGDFLYAFVATGYTGGGLNVFTSTAGGPAPFGPVTVKNYETGWKRSSWFDGHLRTQLAAYYSEYNDFQVTLSDPAIPQSRYEINLPGTTEMYGVEAEAQASFGQFSFTAAVGLLKSSISNFWAIDPRYNTLAQAYATAGFTCNSSTGGTNPYCVNVTGHSITYAPSLTYNLNAEYRFNLAHGGTLTPRINFAYVSPQWASIFANPALGDRLGARDLLGGQLEYWAGDWSLTLYGTNLLNKQYVTANNSGGQYAGPPRQFGIRLMKTF